MCLQMRWCYSLASVLYKVFEFYHSIWYMIIMIIAIMTMLIGNLFAVRQQNIKRFLSFSSIAQVGFILVCISSHSFQGTASVVYFVLIYIFSNLAAFGVAGLIFFYTGREKIDEFKGLYKNNPFLGWMLTLALFSLAGIPPTAGFFGKLFFCVQAYMKLTQSTGFIPV